jgi:hypothetical protein
MCIITIYTEAVANTPLNVAKVLPYDLELAIEFPGVTIYISLRRTSNGHICTLDSGKVLALHL